MQLEVILILSSAMILREQENDINAGLNYGYTLLLSIFARVSPDRLFYTTRTKTCQPI